MKTQTQTIVNGVNVSQLFETIDNIKENKKIAKFNFRAKNKWIGGTENHTTVEDFYDANTFHEILLMSLIIENTFYAITGGI